MTAEQTLAAFANRAFTEAKEGLREALEGGNEPSARVVLLKHDPPSYFIINLSVSKQLWGPLIRHAAITGRADAILFISATWVSARSVDDAPPDVLPRDDPNHQHAVLCAAMTKEGDFDVEMLTYDLDPASNPARVADEWIKTESSPYAHRFLRGLAAMWEVPR